MKSKKSRYDLQSVLSTAGKLSCKRTASKRCTNIEILWNRKLVSLASPEFREVLLPRSLRRWRPYALNTPKVSTATGSKLQRCSGHRGQRTSPPYGKLPSLLLHLPHERISIYDSASGHVTVTSQPIPYYYYYYYYYYYMALCLTLVFRRSRRSCGIQYSTKTSSS